jgi:hypothetical protein
MVQFLASIGLPNKFHVVIVNDSMELVVRQIVNARVSFHVEIPMITKAGNSQEDCGKKPLPQKCNQTFSLLMAKTNI